MKKVLIIGLVFPEPNSTAAGKRMMQLISFFKAQSYSVIFGSTAKKNKFSSNLENIGIETVPLKLNHHSFDEFIEKLNPDIVLFDRFISEEQFGWRVTKFSPSAIRILDTEDLHCLRMGREKAFKAVKEFKPFDLFDLEITKREIASIYRCDLTLMISKFEMNLLKNQFQISEKLLYYLPFTEKQLSLEELAFKPSFEERAHCISIGNFKHEPNWQSVLYLKNNIWPLIRKALPHTELHIYGAYPDQKVQSLHNEAEGFLIKGRAKDAYDVIGKARLLLAPLQFGAGLKGKLLDAMCCGTPSITTGIGAEGMHEGLAWNGVIIDDPTAFAKSAAKLYNHKADFEFAQQNGVQIVNQLFSITHLNDLEKKLAELMHNLDQHRNENFIGAMLTHHTLQSAKYLSKWIEEKKKFSN